MQRITFIVSPLLALPVDPLPQTKCISTAALSKDRALKMALLDANVLLNNSQIIPSHLLHPTKLVGAMLLVFNSYFPSPSSFISFFIHSGQNFWLVLIELQQVTWPITATNKMRNTFTKLTCSIKR